jgi:hypothetical protein
MWWLAGLEYSAYMKTETLLEHCLQALKTGEDISPEVARYLARHPEQRAEVEDLLYIAGRASQLPSAHLSARSRARMTNNLASKLGFDPSALDAAARNPETHEAEFEPAGRRKPRLMVGRLSLARLRYEPPAPSRDPVSEARIREVFRDLTPEDVRRYIGVRGIDYLHYRQRFPGWRPLFMMIAALLRGFKRIEQFVDIRDGY